MSSLDEALKRLDVSNDNHWTAEGVPRLDTVKLLSGDSTVTRDQIEIEFPGFNRKNAQTYVKPDAQPNSAATFTPTTPAEVQLAEAFGKAGATPEAAVAEVEAIVYTIEGLQEKQNLLNEVLAGIAKAEEFKRNLVQEIDVMLEYFAEKGVAETDGDKIQGYLQSQLALREKQAARNRELSEAGITRELLKSIIPAKAPIDEAFLNKRK